MAMLVIDMAAATGDAAATSALIDEAAFGARYISYHGFARFEGQTEALDPGMIVWPGGSLAETRPDRYGLEYDGLYAAETGKPGLAEIIAHANEIGAALSVVLPTARYVGREEVLQTELDGFLSDLLGGTYGPLPEKLILEIGNEYYANFEGTPVEGAAAYGAIADLMVQWIASALEGADAPLAAGTVEIAVQAGRTLAEDSAIRQALSGESLGAVDAIIHHRFAFRAEGIDRRIEDLGEIQSAWSAAVEEVGGQAPGLHVSAYNVASLTRQEALDQYLAQTPGVSAADIDLEARTHTDFEQFWQERLRAYDYGAEHPAFLIEAFSSFAEQGMTSAAAFGVDSAHAGRLSLRDEAGVDHLFIGGEMLRMMAEALVDTTYVPLDRQQRQQAGLTPYVFDGPDKLVVFLVADGGAPGPVTLAVPAIDAPGISLFADSLTAGTNADWMADFGIADNPFVDESAEAQTYLPGIRRAADVVIDDGLVTVDLSEHEVVRLVFAKSSAAAVEAAAISAAPGLSFVPRPVLSGHVFRDHDRDGGPSSGEGVEGVTVESGGFAARSDGFGEFMTPLDETGRVSLSQGKRVLEIAFHDLNGAGTLNVVNGRSIQSTDSLSILKGVRKVQLIGDADATVFGHRDKNVLIGNDGDNTLAGRGGRDRLSGGEGQDTLLGGGGHDRLSGDVGDDFLQGGGGKDRLLGGSGDDVIDGAGGGDRLKGGVGDDTLSGGGGRDRLKGGDGADTFVFQSGMGRDQVVDFDEGEGDVIRFADPVDAPSFAAWFNAHVRQVSGGVRIADGKDMLFLRGADIDDLSVDQFDFADPDLSGDWFLV